MDDISSLENLESVLNSKFKDELTIQISETGSKPFLVIRQLRPSDLRFVPSFYLVATPHNVETQFVLKLLSFHGKVLEESIVDLTTDDDHQFDVIEDFSDDVLSLCRGRAKITDVSLNEFSQKDILIERLEEDIVFRSFNCNYVIKKSPSNNSQTCEFCRNLEVGKIVENGVISTENDNSNYDENASSGFDPDEANKASQLLHKLKSLNLPVTVSLNDKPPSKHKVLNTTEHHHSGEVVPLKTAICDETDNQKPVLPAKKHSDALSTVLITKKKSSVIEITGKTVTNRCSWCGSVFHRLYLFMDHLKVCSKVPKPVSKPAWVPRPKNQSSRPTLQSADRSPEIFRQQCKVCLHVYTNHARFVHDMRQHRKQLKIDLDSPVTCPACKEVVEKRLFLNDHFTAKHPDRENRGVCCQCLQLMPPEKLKHHFYYKHHVQQVDRKHLCPLCGKSLTYSYQLQVHMAVHHKGEADPNTGTVQTDSGEKAVATEVMCDQCGKVFAHRALLCVHVRKQHLRSKAFPCEFCSKAFNAPGALLEHLGSIHLKLKPYKCKECDYITSHKNNIYKHFQQHHGRKGNFDDVETIDQVLDELKQYIKKTEQTQKSDDSQN